MRCRDGYAVDGRLSAAALPELEVAAVAAPVAGSELDDELAGTAEYAYGWPAGGADPASGSVGAPEFAFDMEYGFGEVRSRRRRRLAQKKARAVSSPRSSSPPMTPPAMAPAGVLFLGAGGDVEDCEDEGDEGDGDGLDKSEAEVVLVT